MSAVVISALKTTQLSTIPDSSRTALSGLSNPTRKSPTRTTRTTRKKGTTGSRSSGGSVLVIIIRRRIDGVTPGNINIVGIGEKIQSVPRGVVVVVVVVLLDCEILLLFSVTREFLLVVSDESVVRAGSQDEDHHEVDDDECGVSGESLNLMSNGAKSNSSVVRVLQRPHQAPDPPPPAAAARLPLPSPPAAASVPRSSARAHLLVSVHQEEESGGEEEHQEAGDREEEKAVEQQEQEPHQGGPTMTVNVTSGSTGVTQNNNSHHHHHHHHHQYHQNHHHPQQQINKATVLTTSKPGQVGMTMTMAPVSTSLASMSPAPASTVVGSNNNTLVFNNNVNSLVENPLLTSSQNVIPNINNHLHNRSSDSDSGGKTVLVNNVIPHNSSGGTPNGLQNLGVHSAGATTTSNSVLTPQHLAAMTVNVTGTTGPGNPNQHQQTLVIGKHPNAGIVTTQQNTSLASVNPACLGTTSSGVNSAPSPTIISTAGGGIRILNMNMNAVQAAATVGAGSPANVQTTGAAGVPTNAAQKSLAPRMIISPQMIGARPGQPGVQEYQSEFSEFLMLNYKQSVNEDSGSREDDCVGGEDDDPMFSKEPEADGLSKDDRQDDVEQGPVSSGKSSTTEIVDHTELNLDPNSKLSDSEFFPVPPSLTLTPPAVESPQLSPEKSNCSDTINFLQAFSSNPYDCEQQSESEQQLPDESGCCSNSSTTHNSENSEGMLHSLVDTASARHNSSDDNDARSANSDRNFTESTFYGASQEVHDSDAYIKSSKCNNSDTYTSTELPHSSSKLPQCQSADPSIAEDVSFSQEFHHHSDAAGVDMEVAELLYDSSGESARADEVTKDFSSISNEKQPGFPRSLPQFDTSATLTVPPSVSQPEHENRQAFLTASHSSTCQYSPSSFPATLAAPIESSSSASSFMGATRMSSHSQNEQAIHFPIHIRVPPRPQHQLYTSHLQPPRPLPPSSQQQQNISNKMNAEYKTKCFTSDAQLQSQFLRYNQQHPIHTSAPSGSSNSRSKYTRVSPISQNHHSVFPHYSFNRARGNSGYSNPSGTYDSVGPGDHSSLPNVQQPRSANFPSVSYSSARPNVPTSGCDYYNRPNSLTSSPVHPSYPFHPPTGPTQHQPEHSLQPQVQTQSNNRNIPSQQPPRSNPIVSPTRPSRAPSPNSFGMNAGWMSVSPNSSSGSLSSNSNGTGPSMNKSGSVSVNRYGQTREMAGNFTSKYPHIRYHSPVGPVPSPQTSASPTMICHYLGPGDSHRSGVGGNSNVIHMGGSVNNVNNGNRYASIPSRHEQGVIHPNSLVPTSGSSRVQSKNHSRSSYPQQQYHNTSGHYGNRPSLGGQYNVQNQSQYFQGGGGQLAVSNPNCSASSNGPSQAGYPLVCRVSPIRTRYDDAANFRVNSFSHNQSSSQYPSLPPPHPIPTGSVGTAQDPNFSSTNYQALGAGRQDCNYPYESQYSDARNIRTQITLQALPGLPPGAQGPHLLVKTENGQYQLLRVGMSTPSQAPPTAASGTNPSNPPTPCPNTTSIAQSSSTPSNISCSVASSSTVMTTSLQQQQSNLTVAGMTPTNNIVTSNTSGTVLNSIMGNAVVNSPRLPMTTGNLVHANNISAVPTASSTSAISSTTIPSPVVSANPHATYRLQTVPTVPPTAASNSSGMGMPMQPQAYPHPQHPPQGSPSVASNPSATANSVSQMSAETAKMKCKNFLSFLLELSAKQNATVARNVKSLIQGLVDGKVNAEDFSDRLQKEVNSQPQPCLVGFLKKSLPHLRQSLATKELTIDGIKAPALSSVGPTAPVTALIPQNQQVRPQTMPTPVRIITPINASPSPVSTTSSPAPIPRSTAAAVQQRFATPSKVNTSSSRSNASSKSNAASISAASPSTPSSISASSNKSSGPSSSKSNSKDKDKKGAAAAAFSGGDDDINDVAAMGGVNLAEESQRILGSTEFVGTQIRSCKDESFLPAMLLQSRIKATAAKYGLEDAAPEVASMISHATEERLKNLIEKLSVIAEHRLDVIKVDERYEISQDVKGQLRFLEELDKLERKRHDEQEREILIKAAKSRSKSEDPEQAKLKAKAKEMQRVALEEMRQREANLTALQAIGPRKKPKLDTPSSQSTTAQTTMGGQGASNSLNRPQIGMRPRLKRVNLRDLLFLMEQDKETQRSHFLYKNLLLK